MFKQGEGLIGLRLNKGSLDVGCIYLDPRSTMTTLAPHPKSDALHTGGVNDIFAVIYDSTLYKIKVTPELTSGETFAVASILTGHGATATIANHESFPSNLNSYLFDRYTGQVYNLNIGPYTFANDTTIQDYRFDWFVGESTVGLPEAFEQSAKFGWQWSNNEIRLTAVDAAYEGLVRVTSLTGQILFEQKGVVHGMILPEFTVSGYAIVSIDCKESFLIPTLK